MVGGMIVPATASASSGLGNVWLSTYDNYEAPRSGCKSYIMKFTAVTYPEDPNDWLDVDWGVSWELQDRNGNWVDSGYTYGEGSMTVEETFSLCSYGTVGGAHKIVGQAEFVDYTSNPNRIELQEKTYATFNVNTAPPPAPPPAKKKKKKMKVAAWAGMGRDWTDRYISIDVDPNRKKYRVKIQKKKRGKWRTVRVAKTRGRHAKRTVKVKTRGRYRVVVPRQHRMKRVKTRSFRVTGKKFTEPNWSSHS